MNQEDDDQPEDLMSRMELGIALRSRRLSSEHGNILSVRVYRLLRMTKTTQRFRDEVDRRFKEIYQEGIGLDSASQEKFNEFELIIGYKETGIEEGPFTRNSGAILERRAYIIAVREYLGFELGNVVRPNDMLRDGLTEWRLDYIQYFDKEPLGLTV